MTISKIKYGLQLPEMLKTIFSDIVSEGGTPYIVGGFVRDYVMGIAKYKDIDIEVYLMSLPKLKAILDRYGPTKMVGQKFGVLKLYEWDFSIPRRDNNVGVGHKDFEVVLDPNMSPEEGAMRRDFAINSMFINPLNNILHDPFDGSSYIKRRELIHTNKDQFSEDPLRALRAFQFAGRFDMYVNPETAKLCRSMIGEYVHLPVERIWAEWEKWALKSTTPSAGLRTLEDIRWLALYPELYKMDGTHQDPQWHPEGDVWIHTLFVVDEMQWILTSTEFSDERKLVLMFAALLHDCGKPTTTEINEAGRWVSPKHASVGALIAADFMFRIGAPPKVIEQVQMLIQQHMWIASATKMSKKMVRRMIHKLSSVGLIIEDLAYVILADVGGRPPLPKTSPELLRQAMKLADEIGDEVKPIIMGRDLIDLGLQPGPQFGVVLGALFELQLEGAFEDKEGGLEMLNTIVENSKLLEE